jgi:hypothetical protein
MSARLKHSMARTAIYKSISDRPIFLRMRSIVICVMVARFAHDKLSSFFARQRDWCVPMPAMQEPLARLRASICCRRRRPCQIASREQGNVDRSRIAGGEAYEVRYVARKHGISRGQAEKFIRQARGSRGRANALAKRAA